MTGSLRWLYRSSHVKNAVVAIVLVVCLVAIGAFATDASSAQPDPVAFDQTKSFGVAAEERLALEARNLSLPRVQVFYSQYPYVVGYVEVQRAVATLAQPEHTAQFGRPLTIYVSDYDQTELELTEEGYLQTTRDPDWVAADEAWFVVGSRARTTTDTAVVPFGTRSTAQAFAAANGGEVVTWAALDSYSFDLDDAATVRNRVTADQRSADKRIASVESLYDRETSITVGADAPTIQAAIEQAPPNSTVVVPPGTYEEHVTVDRPLTIRGENATIKGNWTSTVVRVTHDNVAITGVSITGVGPKNRPKDAFEGEGGRWDDRIDDAYGRSDAAIRINASRVSVNNVDIETPTTGVLVRDSTTVVVEDVSLDGSDEPIAGFMGVLSIRSPVVVQNSTFDGGRDGIYLHRARGSVLRNNTFAGQRFGIHFMYTSESLIANNTARNQTVAGFVIMTNPTRNAVVGNDVRRAENGFILSGSHFYVAKNVAANNTNRGIQIGTTQSAYEQNLLYGNHVGIRADTLLPSNQISSNDFVANRRHAKAGLGPLRIWTEDSRGNYWEGAHGFSASETFGRSYSPTNPVERRFHRVDGTVTLAESPAAKSLAAIRGQSPGLREGEIVDIAPLARPARPEVLAEVRAELVADDRVTGRQSGGERGG
jgi:parallel beta-helix repeat protein